MILTTTQKYQLNQIRQSHRLSLLLLCGSQIGTQVHPNSDTDIAILRQPGVLELDSLKLINQLHLVFHTEKIDLIDITHADPLLLHSITTNSILLSGRLHELELLQLKAFHLYNDYQPYLKLEREFVQERLSQ